MEKLLTLIIPTYNMSQYIERCLRSLLSAQTDGALEVLVVNDGSTDNSSQLAKSVADEWSSVHVIDKENGNYGSCVNVGLKAATGKYVKVLDADDYFDIHALESLLGALAETNADLVLTDFSMHFSNKVKTRRFSLPPYQDLKFVDVCTQKEFVHLWMHSVAYRRAIFDGLEYHQTEGISYTDQQWIFLPMTRVSTVRYIPVDLYQYNRDREGQTMSPAFMSKHFNDHIVCFKAMIKQYSELPPSTPREIKTMLHKRLFRLTRYVYKRCLTNNLQKNLHNELKDFDEYLRNKAPKLYSDIGNVMLSKPLMPYHYIRRWRKGDCGKVFSCMITLYRWKKHANL